MPENAWRAKLRRLPLIGGVVAALDTVRDVYDAVGWTDPGYHSIRSGEERLDEARRVAAIGNRPDPAHAQTGEQQVDTDRPGGNAEGHQQAGPRSSQTLQQPGGDEARADPDGIGQEGDLT